MELYCKKCNFKLTPTALRHVISEDLDLRDQAPLIAPGGYIYASEEAFHFEVPIDFLVNKESIVLNDHKDSSRLSGCCGPGDFSVLNQVCPNCSAEIGVMIADCWLPHFVGISGAAVSTKALW